MLILHLVDVISTHSFIQLPIWTKCIDTVSMAWYWSRKSLICRRHFLMLQSGGATNDWDGFFVYPAWCIMKLTQIVASKRKDVVAFQWAYGAEMNWIFRVGIWIERIITSRKRDMIKDIKIDMQVSFLYNLETIRFHGQAHSQSIRPDKHFIRWLNGMQLCMGSSPSKRHRCFGFRSFWCEAYSKINILSDQFWLIRLFRSCVWKDFFVMRTKLPSFDLFIDLTFFQMRWCFQTEKIQYSCWFYYFKKGFIQRCWCFLHSIKVSIIFQPLLPAMLSLFVGKQVFSVFFVGKAWKAQGRKESVAGEPGPTSDGQLWLAIDLSFCCHVWKCGWINVLLFSQKLLIFL